MIPIDKLTEFESSINLVLSRTSKEALEKAYMIELPERYSAQTFLSIFGKFRGIVRSTGEPDLNKISKIIHF